ncbi:MFS transporter, partial [Chloroflexota bacterium]
IGYSPDGVPLKENERMSEKTRPKATGLTDTASEYTFKEAVSRPAFWIVIYVSIVFMFSVTMVSTHVMPYLEEIGYSRYTASIVAMMIPATSIGGRLAIGWVSDFLSRRILLILMVVGQVIGVVLFLYVHLSYLMIPFVIFFGVSYGGIVILRPAILRDYYGSIHIGSLIGLLMGLSSIGGIFGSLVGGWVFDTTGSYSPALIASGLLLLSGAPLVLIMKKPQAKEKEHV